MLNQSFQFNTIISGVLGFGSSKSDVLVYFESNVYSAGDTVKLHIDANNSECKSGIKSFKIKLQRKIFGMTPEESYIASEYVKCSKSQEGVPANQKASMTVNVKIPKFNSELEVYNGLPNYLCSSFHGAAVSVQYYLRFFIKYQGLTQTGEGHCITMPIWI